MSEEFSDYLEETLLNLASAFKYSADRHINNQLLQGASEGMWPFKFDHLDLSFDINFDRYKIYAVVVGPELHVVHKAIVDRDDVLDEPYRWVEGVRSELLDAFRTREAEPIPDNIILGTE